MLSNTISLSTPNDDAFAWTVPSVLSGSDYQIKVTSTTNSQFTGTSGNFTIQGTTPIPVLTSIAISPVSASINVNSTIQLSSVCKDQNNNTMTCPALTWASSNTAIATVSSSGLVTGVSSGTVSITARSGTITSNLSTITVAAISGSITVTTQSTGLI